MATAGRAVKERRDLRSWFSIWVPSYGPSIVQIALLAAALGGAVYAENVAIGELTKSFAVSADALAEDGLLRMVSAATGGSAVRLAVALLALVVITRLGRMAIDVTVKRKTQRLQHRARGDLEKEILDHLLRKDDAFFTTNPPAEILNRLSSDITRVIERRTTAAELLESIFLIVGNVYFFLREDWRLALAGVVTCAAGAYAMHRMTYPVQEMDFAYLTRDDHVKATFEDFLRASPEVQVAGLRRSVRRRFEKAQASRREMFLKFTTLNSRLSIASTVSYLVSFVALFAIAIFMMRDETGRTAAAGLALVPVVIKALPELFTNASQVVFHRLTLQLAETSQERLVEYEAGTAADEDDDDALDAPAISGDIVLEDVTYRYRTEEGTLQGGIVGVSTELPRGRWTAVVGPAGSGKSTFLQLVVGRTRPRTGRLLYAGRPYDELGAAQRSRVLTLMPQTLAILDASIAENLLFAKDASELDDDDLRLVDETGLGAICRTKALAMLPEQADDGASALAKQIVELRAAVRAKLAEAGTNVEPLEDGAADETALVAEALIGGRADREALVGKLFDPSSRRTLDRVQDTALGRALLEGARGVIADTHALLALPSHAEYTKLAPLPLDERVWSLRSGALARPEPRALLLVALTAHASELRIAKIDRDGIELLRDLVSGVCRPFDARSVHPHLTWRENLVFGRIDVPNARAEGRVDRAILDVIDARGLGSAFVRIGLAYEVGRGGARLSGGQRQLVALTRALLRRTPVIVLDEPTSALDPKSRARVAQVLAAWAAADRIVVTVSHDPDLVRAADAVRLFEAGRLVGAGTFAELERESAAFREILEVG